MKLDSKLFKSKLAWRFFGLFIVCAFVPIVAMAMIAHTHVAGRLESQAHERLREYAKSHGMSIIEHLILARGQLQLLAPAVATGVLDLGDDVFEEAISGARIGSTTCFERVGLYSRERYRALAGAPIPIDAITPATQRLTSIGQTTLFILPAEGEFPLIGLIYKIADRAASMQGPCYLVGVVNSDFLWGLADGTILPAAIQWSVWDHRRVTLFSTLSKEQRNHLDLDDAIESGEPSGQFDLNLFSGDYLGAHWSMFIKPLFHTARWVVLVAEPKSDVMAPFYKFQTFFPLIVLLTIGIVILLSSVAIRKSLVPIDSLLQGARRISRGHFVQQVEVASRDEFHDLAVAFNRMSEQLDKQFKAQSARSDVDRAILSLLDVRAIVAKILPRLNLFFPCITGAIVLLDEEIPDQAEIYMDDSDEPLPKARRCIVSKEVRRLLKDQPGCVAVADADSPFSFLWDLGIAGATVWTLFPVYRQNQPIALVCYAGDDGEGVPVGDLEQAGRLAHQLAVALSNAGLIRELKALNMGTLNALARTVDAKSSWTAGHSERVMQMSIQIGKAMGLTTDQLNDLHKAAFLHDIGKIGIPVSILDKTEPLTGDEFDRIRTHPSIGARILDPISAYHRLIPIVEQHHERYDGRGYPHGLTGEAIHPLARIMAVADAYDAMVSNRPYRKGMPLAKVRAIIHEESGRQFDPDVVKAFELVLSAQFPFAMTGGDGLAPPVSMRPTAALAR